MESSRSVEEHGARRFLGPGESVYGRNAREHKVVLASYPRSGNSLLRSLIEVMCDGVVTGSDTAPTRTLSRALRDFGMLGEGVIDERVLVVKSHFPERRGLAKMAVRRALLLVRNPWDVIDSYFNMTLTNSHNTTMHDSQYERFADLFQSLALAETRVWCQFNQWWLEAPNVDLLLVRYEDLIVHTRPTLRRVAWFLNGCEPIENTPWADGLERAMSLDLSRAGPYTPRRATSQSAFPASLRRFTPELRSQINLIAKSMLRNFGYDESKKFFSSTEPLQLAKRALRLPVPTTSNVHLDDSFDANQEYTVVINQGPEIRHTDSPYGRFMTTLRKSLTEPVIADNGQPLNMHEVIIARDCVAAETAANAALCELRPHPSDAAANQRREPPLDNRKRSQSKIVSKQQHTTTSFGSKKNSGLVRTKAEQLRLLRQANAGSSLNSALSSPIHTATDSSNSALP